jgi:hypothetical protein
MHGVTFLITVVFVIGIFSTFATTITSTSQGGLWGETTTWVGEVPTQTDDVVITSVVTTGNVSYSSRTL